MRVVHFFLTSLFCVAVARPLHHSISRRSFFPHRPSLFGTTRLASGFLLQKPGATAPGFTRVWGRPATNKRAPGIYRRIACRYLFHGISRSAQFHLRSRQQVHLGAYPAHLRSSIRFQSLPACRHSQSSSGESGQSLQIRLRHPGTRLFCCGDCVLSSQLHYCRIAPPHPAFPTPSV